MQAMTKVSAAARRNARTRLDQNIARAATPRFLKTIKAEQARVVKATASASTPAAWNKAARGAVLDSQWVATVVTLWLSDPIRKLWTAQQVELGTDFPIPASVTSSMSSIGKSHGLSIADTRRDRLTSLLPADAKADRLSPTRVFRSTMRKAVRESYEGAATKAARMALTETQMATETIRYESARVSSTRTKHKLRKVWFTVGDLQVRQSHQAVNGQSRVVSHEGWGGRPGKFRVGGAALRFPRDPTGPPGEVINCRCFLEYRKVRRPG